MSATRIHQQSCTNVTPRCAQAKLEGLEARIQELTADVGQLRVQLARSEAERQTLAQHVNSLQASHAPAPPVRAVPVRGRPPESCRSNP